MYTAIYEGAAEAMMPGSMVVPWPHLEQPRLLGALGAEVFLPGGCPSPWAGKKTKAPPGLRRRGRPSAGPGYEPGRVLAGCADLGSPLPRPLALHERLAIPADLGGGHAERTSPASAKVAQASPPLSPERAQQPGSPEVPTEGSLLHNIGCKPCAFLNKEGGCKTGAACKFCHLCQPDEKKIRKKNWKQMKRLEAILSGAPADNCMDALSNDSFGYIFQSAL
ncbi:unnamed protein product [Prorocentrum cordatum]|uniref:C3H1-type domain-containing protein n=1 Tax=Prorocentrum cordatum TaxID=2364126 RepID=A0ABN9U4D6_9DINO|nr:unnamed protein product [Polarella glacialis]|mmetsp:Transcript_37268/g.97196  ORF Transcript_37268/g.97196 Transcript_37268/m.97196 type:complete len:222 (+) Transcript_37268:107-772(+)